MDLKNELNQLSKIEPSEGFIKASKNRLLERMANESPDGWFLALVKKMGFNPSPQFIAEARQRLMAQIKELPSPVKLPLKGLALALNFLKKAVASTLVMAIAVTAVLFQLEGNTVVEASNDSYLEVVDGTVSVKQNDLEWARVSGQTQLHSGDLVQVGEDSKAVIQFFDGSELRLDEETTLHINQIAFSPSFEGQGVIEATLQEGQVWAQTLNVDDGHARLTLVTNEGVVNALNASFSVNSLANQSAEVAVLNGSVKISTFSSETGELLQKTRIAANKVVTLSPDEQNQGILLEESDLTAQMKATEWVTSNLKEDEKHLAELSDLSLERLTLMAGTLPGDTLYSIKKAKENLKLMWSDDADLSVRIDIANNRLNEAIVLFERGEVTMAEESLKAYEALTHEILAANPPQNAETTQELITKLVTPHQKVLSTQPADKNSLVVKEKLKETAEVLAQNSPVDLENVQLKNSVASLQDIKTLIEKGDLELAKEEFKKYQVPEVKVAVLENVGDEALEQVLDLKKEEKDLLALVQEKTNSSALEKDEELVAMVESTSKKVEADVEEIESVALTAMPELVSPKEEVIKNTPTIEFSTPNEASTEAPNEAIKPVSEAEALAAKINIYSTWDAQMNQIHHLLGAYLEDTSKIDFLLEVNKHLSGRIKNYLSTRILQLQNKLDLEKAAKEKELETPAIQPSPTTTPTPSETTTPTSTSSGSATTTTQLRTDLDNVKL